MKTILKYLKESPVSSLFLAVTVGLFIYFVLRLPGYENIGYFLLLVALFIFRGIMWEGQYRQVNQKLKNIIDHGNTGGDV